VRAVHNVRGVGAAGGGVKALCTGHESLGSQHLTCNMRNEHLTLCQ